jgi:hypothetical protein
VPRREDNPQQANGMRNRARFTTLGHTAQGSPEFENVARRSISRLSSLTASAFPSLRSGPPDTGTPLPLFRGWTILRLPGRSASVSISSSAASLPCLSPKQRPHSQRIHGQN